MIRLFFTIWCILGISIFSYGQLQKSWILDAKFQYGRIIEHNTRFIPDVTENTVGFEINIERQLNGEEAWHQMHNYPIGGIAIQYHRFGDFDIFGNGFTFLPYFKIPVFCYSKSNLFFKIGTGLAYIDRPFHIKKNPTNNLIGEHWNRTINLGFYYYYAFCPNWNVQLGASVMHYSSGAYSLPNLGINVAQASFGIRYLMKPHASFKHHEDANIYTKKIGLAVHLSTGLREGISSGGPKYAIYIINIAATRYVSKTNLLHVGLGFEYNTFVHRFMENAGYYDIDNKNRLRAARAIITIDDEIFFGNVSLKGGLGFYLYRGFLSGLFFYSKLSARYYFPSIGNSKSRIFVSTDLKAHLATAEYASFGVGVLY